MNEKGFGLKEFIIIIAVVFVSLLIIMSLLKNISSNAKSEPQVNQTEKQEKTYKDLEQELKLAAERYQNDNYSGNIENSEVWTLSYSMLKENGYLNKIKDIKDTDTECTGYVKFTQDGGIITYTPYLKCGSNYKTKGYSEN